VQYAKAILAALLAGLAALGTALLDNQVAPVEWVGIATATLTGLAVWRVPNHQPDDVDRLVAREELRAHVKPGTHRRDSGTRHVTRAEADKGQPIAGPDFGPYPDGPDFGPYPDGPGHQI